MDCLIVFLYNISLTLIRGFNRIVAKYDSYEIFCNLLVVGSPLA